MSDDKSATGQQPPQKSYHQRALEMRDKLNAVSNCFCVAKFKQVTLHLQSGLLHSCHHPRPHKIPLNEIAANPAALANTKHLKAERKKMLAGQRPFECDYCWKIEDSGNNLSDRHLKSAEYWARDLFEESASSGADKDFLPGYLEVSFSNKCQLRCSYCSPESSSSWQQEIERIGPYLLSDSEQYLGQFDALNTSHQLLEEESNPYIEAFWKWWPELYPALKVFRITGGEPLLSQNTYRVLDWIGKNPRRDLQLAINTNLAVPSPVFSRFLDQIEPLVRDRAFERFTVFSSIDTFGDPADYIRSGLDSRIWLSNVHRLLERLPNIYFTVMCTFNALSVSNFEELLKQMLALKNIYAKNFGERIVLDIAYLRYPEHMSVQVLDAHHLQKLESLGQRMNEMHRDARAAGQTGFEAVELEKMQRLIQWSKVAVAPERLSRLRKNFALYFTELDRRRGCNFLATFPQMRDFWQQCLDSTALRINE